MKKIVVFIVVLLSLLLAVLFLLLNPHVTFAHEAYVLTREQFNQGLKTTNVNPLASLFDTSYFLITVIITISLVSLYTLVGIFSTTSLASKLDKYIKKGRVLGPLIVRLAISSSFFFAAQTNSILGPEISLSSLPYGELLRTVLYAISAMVFLGFFVEIAALIGLLIFGYITFYYGHYMLTYLNYFGELVALLIFGSRFLSFDKFLLGKKTIFSKLEKYRELEVPIVRILYGLALIYTAVNIKFLHPLIPVTVYNQYKLHDYFFNAPASFIAAGAGLSEFLIGFFIVLGLSVRLTVIISLIFITLSLLYFRELVWPHFMLYGISLSLILNAGDKLSLEHYLIPKAREFRLKVLSLVGFRQT